VVRLPQHLKNYYYQL